MDNADNAFLEQADPSFWKACFRVAFLGMCDCIVSGQGQVQTSSRNAVSVSKGMRPCCHAGVSAAPRSLDLESFATRCLEPVLVATNRHEKNAPTTGREH